MASSASSARADLDAEGFYTSPILKEKIDPGLVFDLYPGSWRRRTQLGYEASLKAWSESLQAPTSIGCQDEYDEAMYASSLRQESPLQLHFFLSPCLL